MTIVIESYTKIDSSSNKVLLGTSRFLTYATDSSKIDMGDTYLVMLYLTRNPVARPFVWDFFVENKAWFKKR